LVLSILTSDGKNGCAFIYQLPSNFLHHFFIFLCHTKSVSFSHFRRLIHTMMRYSEESLLQGAARFDQPALAEIYDRHSPGLYRYALRMLGNEGQAEDCVAETFSRFLLALRAGNGPNLILKAYLYRICHNLITDIFRRQPPPPMELDEELHSSGDHPPDRQAEAHLEQEQVRAALRRLTPEQHQVVSLRFLEEWSLEETAAALQKPVGAVKALQHRALASLHRLLSSEEGRNYEISG
jgi:RNA polymerase sigma-70 factor (ECF subfamily)